MVRVPRTDVEGKLSKVLFGWITIQIELEHKFEEYSLFVFCPCDGITQPVSCYYFTDLELQEEERLDTLF